MILRVINKYYLQFFYFFIEMNAPFYVGYIKLELQNTGKGKSKPAVEKSNSMNSFIKVLDNG
jgi:hypothetical protein